MMDEVLSHGCHRCRVIGIVWRYLNWRDPATVYYGAMGLLYIQWGRPEIFWRLQLASTFLDFGWRQGKVRLKQPLM